MFAWCILILLGILKLIFTTLAVKTNISPMIEAKKEDSTMGSKFDMRILIIAGFIDSIHATLVNSFGNLT